MRKSTLFISAVLTTFMLVILVGVVSAYKNTLNTTGVKTAQQEPTAVAVDTSVPTSAPILTPEQAAALAAQVIGRTDLFSVETTLFNNADAYLVTFSSGDLVYVSPAGQILSIGQVAAVANTQFVPAPVKTKPRNRPGNTGGGGDGGGEPHDD